MLAAKQPKEAYRQSHFDARVKGAASDDIVLFCLEELVLTLGTLLHADRTENRAGRSNAITRGIAIITALEMGVDRSAEIGPSLLQFYGAARDALLESLKHTETERIESLRADILEIKGALTQAKLGG